MMQTLDIDAELAVCEARLNCKTFVIGDPPSQLEKYAEALRRLKRLREIFTMPKMYAEFLGPQSEAVAIHAEIDSLLNIREG